MSSQYDIDSARLPDYAPIDIERARPIGTKVYIKWELKNRELLGGKLILPDSHRGQQYTGTVIRFGCDVPVEQYGIKEGDRVLFEQFSGFEKMWDSKQGRIAIVEYFNIFAVIPERCTSRVTNGENDYDFNN